jgi:uncharacterized cupin superfamily protein
MFCPARQAGLSLLREGALRQNTVLNLGSEYRKMSDSLTCFDRLDVAPALDHPKAERLVHGKPLRKTYTHYANADGTVDAGLWECEPGAWRIDFADKRDEFFHVLQGRIRITAEAGEAREFGPGMPCLIPAGFKGLFEVLEPVRKIYVMIDR